MNEGKRKGKKKENNYSLWDFKTHETSNSLQPWAITALHQATTLTLMKLCKWKTTVLKNFMQRRQMEIFDSITRRNLSSFQKH